MKYLRFTPTLHHLFRLPIRAHGHWSLALSAILVFGFILIFGATRSQAGLNMNLHMYQAQYGYFAFPELMTNAVTSNPADTGYFAWGPNSSSSTGIHYELPADGETSGSSANYATYASFQTAINGNWTLLVTNLTSTNEYTFTVDASGVGTEFTPEIVITFPANGATSVESEPLFTWNGPTDWEGSLSVTVRNESYSFYRNSDLDSSETSWPSPIPLNGGTNYFRVSYATNVSSLVPISKPIDGLSNELSGWISTAEMETHRENNFTVAGSGRGDHSLVAHYAFEDDTIYAEDISGHGNDISSPASYGCGTLETTNDAKVGDFAVNFDTDDGDCPSWLSPPTNLVSTVAGSFTISLWVKTSGIFGEDDDDVYSAAGIVSAFSGGDHNVLMPMGITGGKLAFYTGGDGSDDDTLHSETSINTGEYVHLVVTRNQSTGEKKIYVNGVLDASTFASTALLDGATEIEIGQNNGQGFDGNMDDIQIYSGVLSQNEITVLYQNPGITIPDSVNQGGPLGEAVDAPQFFWATGGDTDWFPQTDTTHDGFDAAQAGAIGVDEESWIQATIIGPGTVGFYWKLSDSTCSSEVSFSVDDSTESSIYCDTDWEYYSVEIPPGPQTLKWRYSQYQYASSFGFDIPAEFPVSFDGAWLDEVTFNEEVSPNITSDPDDLRGFTGTNISVTMKYYGNPAPTFTWFKDSVLVPGQTNATLLITNAQPSDSGYYYFVASNYLGSARSDYFLVTITDPTDLRPLTLSAPAVVGTKNFIPVSWTVTNTGPRAVSIYAYSDNLYLLSNNIVVGSTASPSTNFTVAAASTYTITGSVAFPSVPAGNYTLEVRVDSYDSILETDELNNRLSIPISVVVSDIQPGNFQSPSVGIGGKIFEFSYNTTNNGPVEIIGGGRWLWTDQLFLSEDAVWDSGDLYVSQINQLPQTILPGEFFGRTNSFTMPVRPSGNYYLILRADYYYGGLYETDESNNQIVIPIQLTTPDLLPVALNAPTEASTRQPVQITWSIQNIGDAIAQKSGAQWYDRIYLSSNSTINVGSVLLGYFSGAYYYGQEFAWQTPLPAGETMTNSQSLYIPNVTEGNYFLVLTNDFYKYVTEQNETNNSLSVPILIANPDLVVTNVTVPATADAQSVIPVIWEIKNQGLGTAYPTWRDRVYISTNATYETNDTFLGEFQQTKAIGSGSNYLATNFVSIPGFAAGNYFIIVRTDATTNLFEVNRTNNVLATPINIAAPDLAIVQVNTLTNITSQQALNLTFVVTNLGGTIALPSWSDRLYLSTNDTLEAGDIPIHSITGGSPIDFVINTPLPISGSYTQQVDVRVPSVPTGNYFLLVQTDGTNSFSEINEANNVFATAVHLATPDLIATNFFSPPSVTITQLYQKIEIGWNILNQGNGAAQVNWTDYLYISPTNVLDTNAIYIGSESHVAPLLAGQSYLSFDTPNLPNGLQGNYFLILSADNNNNLFEEAETNNLAVLPLQIVIPPLADLSLTEVAGPTEAWSGQEIEISWILTNSGTATVTKPFREALYLSPNADGSGGTHYGTFNFTGTLAPGESVERKQRITLPISLSGLRWPVVVTDSGNEIFEFNRENNNTLVAAQPVNVNLSPFPNLSVTNIASPTNVFSGQQTVVTWAVTNIGTGPTSSPYWYDSVYLSSDAEVGNDIYLGNAPNVSYLNPGESYVNSATVTIPRGIQGTYYFIIRCDAGNYVFESTFENDNNAISPSLFVELTPPPDLRVDSVIAPLNAFSGQSAFLSWGVTNAGQGQTLVSSWYDRVYLSTDTNIDDGDRSLGFFVHGGGLEPGQTYRVTNFVNLPVGISGNYYFIVEADTYGNVFEVPFEENNSRAANSITAIALTPPPDLEATIESAPTTATSSRIVSVRYRVVNNGATTPPDGSWYDRLSISTNPLPSAGDLQLKVQYHANQNYYGKTNYFGVPYLSHMEPGATYTNTISAILPDTLTGVYYIFVTTDSNGTVFEVDKTNNSAVASSPVEIISQPADLIVRSLQAPSVAEAGNAFLISWAVTNIGVGDSAVYQWYDRLVLSADDFLGDSDDVLLINRTHNNLLGVTNEYSVVNELVTIPISISPGEYRLFLIADRYDNVYESNETNNSFGPVNITITRDTSDLQITNLIVPSGGISGSSFTVQWTEKNFGTRTPNASYWVDGVYLSADPLLSPGDLFLGRRQNFSQLAPGQTYTNSLSATLPEDFAGNYYVIVVADDGNRVVEAGLEDNNQFVSAAPVPITLSPVADLAVTVNAPSEAYSGQIFDLNWTVQNIGNAMASNIWYDAAYLSLDHFLDPFTDFYLGYTSRVTNLVAGASYTNHLSFEIPQGISGPYYVFVSTDTSARIYERTNKNNNIAFDPEAMVIQLTPPVDLVAGTITVPANAAPGVNATIVYTVSNLGSNTARGSWEDAVYISADTNFDAGDLLMGRVRHRGDILPNGSYTNSVTAPIPGVLPGDYHVIVRSDILNHLPESNEENNLGASLNSVSIDSEVLVLGTPSSGTIDQGQSVFYKFEAVAGQTIRVRFNTGVHLAGNEIYVRYAQMPSRGQFDFAINEPFIADPDLFIPIEQTGTHYLLVYSGSMPIESPYTILAEVLPFSVATIFPGVAGDRGSTTFKTQGALFDGDTVFQLNQGTNKIPAANVLLENSSVAYVTFNLVNAKNGAWDLSALMDESGVVSSTLSNSVTVISDGVGGVYSLTIGGPSAVWAAFTQRALLSYGNEGTSDLAAPLLVVSALEGTRIGIDVSLLRTNTLQLLGRSLDGPSDILRPQSSHSHTIYCRDGGLHLEARVVTASDTQPITDSDWLEIESSVRPIKVSDFDWTSFWANNIRPRVGSTWGDYVKLVQQLAEVFPAEQRSVQAMFEYYVTNQPNFHASSMISGLVLDSTNNAPLANVQIAFFTVSPDGAVDLGGSATTDGAGQFFVPRISAGQYVCAIGNQPDKVFDMDHNGVEDGHPPKFTILSESDLLNQTIYLAEPAPVVVLPNDADAKLVLDNQNVLHAFWFRNDLLWHARQDNNNWVGAAPITTNVVESFAVSTSANLIDGTSPGIIVVWSQINTNSVDLLYSVGQSGGTGGYEWSLPIRLTDDLSASLQPSVVVRDNGLALISYLKRGVNFHDDTDLYFSAVDVLSGQLLRNDPAPSAEADSGVQRKQSFGWSREFEYKPLGLELKFTTEASGEFTSMDCDAAASFKLEGSAEISEDDYFFNLKGTGEGAFSFYVDPDKCDWKYKPESSAASVGLTGTFGIKNAAFKILKAYPPTSAFSDKLQDFIIGFGEYVGFEFENTVELKIGGALQGLHWKEGPPFSSFGLPSAQKAEASIGGAIKFGASYDNEIKLGEDVLGDPTLKTGLDFKGETSVEVALKAQFYPHWDFLGGTLTPSFSVAIGRYKWAVPFPELVLDYADSDVRPMADENPVPITGTLTIDTASVFGTTNVYGTNAVLANVKSDLLDDGAPALATDANGSYQIWFHEIDPFDTRFGSEIFASDFNGATWSAPTAIPNSDGFNSQVRATTDSLGQRMAVWVHGDSSTVSTNSTFEEFFGARRNVNLYYSLFDGAAWSAPQQVVATTGPDSDLSLSHLANGDVLAVWTSTETNSTVRLLSSRWNGTTWSAIDEIASGNLRKPAAQQVDNAIYIMWTKVERGDSGDRAVSLYQSVNDGSGWSAPTLFDPASVAPDESQSAKMVTYAHAEPDFGEIIFGDIPKKCCKCKGNKLNPPLPNCGISSSHYDYENCRQVYTYKPCPRSAFDPNDIVGPEGFGPEKWVGKNSVWNYVIHFENDALGADAPAKEVIITMALDDDFDARTFRLASFGFGDITINIPPGQAFYSTRLDYTETKGYYLDFFAGVDVAKREAFWRLTTIDPKTGGLPINPFLGFLPPNVTSPEGEGFVGFSLQPKAATENGTRMDAKATIVFDTQPPIDTPEIFNSIETSIPESAISSLPPTIHTSTFDLSWTGSDGAGGSGISAYDIYVSENGGNYFLLVEGTTLDSTPVIGKYGSHYAFYSIAHDNAGNVEDAPLVPDAEVTIASSNTAPVLLNFTNALVVEKTIFSRQIQATDADVPTNILTFELLNGPNGMLLDSTTGLLTWTPGEADGPGTNTIVIKVTDDATPPLSATNSFVVTVLEANEPPQFIGESNYIVDELATLTFTNVVVDPDLPTNQITVQLISGPDGVVFDPATGIVTWTPGETNGGSTNWIIVKATDDAPVPASSFQTNTVVVLEVNAAPVIAGITNRIVLPLSLIEINFADAASDSDVPTNHLTFSLDASNPGTVNPTNGVYRWRPGFEFAGTSHLISAIATDDGTPSLSATQQFVIAIEDFVQIDLGETALFINQTGSVPITANSSAPWQTMKFTLQLPTNLLGQIQLENVSPPSLSAAVVQLDANYSMITFSNAPEQALQGTQHLAQLSFKAVAANSAVVTLNPEAQEITRTNGLFITPLATGSGQITIVGEQPVLNALTLEGNRHSLILFGNPGQNYQIETATNLAEIIGWEFFTNVTMTNIFQPVEGRTNSPMMFYRARLEVGSEP